MSATVSYKQLSRLVDQLIDVVDQSDVTFEVCSSELEREHRRDRLHCEMRTILSRLRESQRDIEKYLSPTAPARRVESQVRDLDDEWESLIDTVKEHLERADRVPTAWFHFIPQPPPSERFKAQTHQDNVARFIRTLDRLWEDTEPVEDRHTVIRRVVAMVNAEFCPMNRKDLLFGRRENGSYGWLPIYDSSNARGSDA